MNYEDKELVKSLTSLIDETLGELEEIKKSSKYEASEITISGPGEDGIHGHKADGDLHAKKKEDKEKDEDEDEMDKKEDCGDMDKGENEKADEDHGKFAQAPSVSKGENEKADEDHGKFAQAPTVSKKEDEDEDEDKMDKYDSKDMKKSLEESEDLIKSYVDAKFEALEDRFAQLADMLEAVADAPVQRRGVPAGVTALNKSADEEQMETLSKSSVANSLFELKKSGGQVDSSDIFMVETCKNYNQLKAIADKYGVK